MAMGVMTARVIRLAGAGGQIQAEVAGPKGRTAGASREVMTR